MTRFLGKITYILSKYFLNLHWKNKILVIFSFVFLTISILLFKSTFSGHGWFPNKEKNILRNFENHAVDIHSYSKEQQMESFVNILIYPENIILIKPFKVNLKRAYRSKRNSMAAIELYVESTSKVSAIEIKDREMEIVDLVQRAAEVMTYADL